MGRRLRLQGQLAVPIAASLSRLAHRFVPVAVSPGDLLKIQAIILERHGGPDVLSVRELPDPRPGVGEVRVRAEAIGVNYAEVLSRKGLYG
jgi:hypothetical protein